MLSLKARLCLQKNKPDRLKLGPAKYKDLLLSWLYSLQYSVGTLDRFTQRVSQSPYQNVPISKLFRLYRGYSCAHFQDNTDIKINENVNLFPKSLNLECLAFYREIVVFSVECGKLWR